MIPPSLTMRSEVGGASAAGFWILKHGYYLESGALSSGNMRGWVGGNGLKRINGWHGAGIFGQTERDRLECYSPTR